MVIDDRDIPIAEFARNELKDALERAHVYQVDIAEVIKEVLGQDAEIIKTNL